ncbi:hypothetical protein FRC01_006598 [Tulasnella sp. 417]|nr:hypothetical protein FRC01_006598 [Tulasnella sp. 417]
MSSNIDKSDSHEGQFGPVFKRYDLAEEEDLIPIPPMAVDVMRGRALSGDPVAYIPIRQERRYFQFDEDGLLESFVTVLMYILLCVSSASNPLHNEDSLVVGHLQPSFT